MHEDVESGLVVGDIKEEHVFVQQRAAVVSGGPVLGGRASVVGILVKDLRAGPRRSRRGLAGLLFHRAPALPSARATGRRAPRPPPASG